VRQKGIRYATEGPSPPRSLAPAVRAPPGPSRTPQYPAEFNLQERDTHMWFTFDEYLCQVVPRSGKICLVGIVPVSPISAAAYLNRYNTKSGERRPLSTKAPPFDTAWEILSRSGHKRQQGDATRPRTNGVHITVNGPPTPTRARTSGSAREECGYLPASPERRIGERVGNSLPPHTLALQSFTPPR